MLLLHFGFLTYLKAGRYNVYRTRHTRLGGRLSGQAVSVCGSNQRGVSRTVGTCQRLSGWFSTWNRWQLVGERNHCDRLFRVADQCRKENGKRKGKLLERVTIVSRIYVLYLSSPVPFSNFANMLVGLQPECLWCVQVLTQKSTFVAASSSMSCWCEGAFNQWAAEEVVVQCCYL